MYCLGLLTRHFPTGRCIQRKYILGTTPPVVEQLRSLFLLMCALNWVFHYLPPDPYFELWVCSGEHALLEQSYSYQSRKGKKLVIGTAGQPSWNEQMCWENYSQPPRHMSAYHLYSYTHKGSSEVTQHSPARMADDRLSQFNQHLACVQGAVRD